MPDCRLKSHRTCCRQYQIQPTQFVAPNFIVLNTKVLQNILSHGSNSLHYMNQIQCCDWLPEQTRWSYHAHSALPTIFCKKNFHKGHSTNPLLVKLVRSRWLDIDLVLFCKFMTQEKKLGQYPAILTEQA